VIIKTTNLIDNELDWAVAKCEGGYDLQLCSTYGTKTVWQYTMKDEEEPERIDKFYLADTPYSTDWALGGPIIEREGISLIRQRPGRWVSEYSNGCDRIDQARQHGPTPLIAAMRCFCLANLGDEVDVPDELCS
jgi:hypothetical protein